MWLSPPNIHFSVFPSGSRTLQQTQATCHGKDIKNKQNSGSWLIGRISSLKECFIKFFLVHQQQASRFYSFVLKMVTKTEEIKVWLNRPTYRLWCMMNVLLVCLVTSLKRTRSCTKISSSANGVLHMYITRCSFWRGVVPCNTSIIIIVIKSLSYYESFFLFSQSRAFLK